MTRVALLPLDDRPVTYDQPAAIGSIAGVEVIRPPREWLGNPWRASRHDELAAWLWETAPEADALIVAVDTLVHGGLIPSRTSDAPPAEALARLEGLRALRRTRPDLDVAAFSVVQRVNRDDNSEEERPYWAEVGSRMFRLSYLEHKRSLRLASPEEEREATRLRQEMPVAYYEDYRTIRNRNHAVNRAALELLREGVIDYLVLPQDDTAEFGWNIAEVRLLQAHIRAHALTERAVSYPGADEIAGLLVARHVCRANGFVPKIWPRFASSGTAPTAYEDRSMPELLKAHLAPLGGTVANSAESADVLLFINAPAEVQGQGELQWLVDLESMGSDPGTVGVGPAAAAGLQATRREMNTVQRDSEEFVRALLEALRSGRTVALADVAFVNGADLNLGKQLLLHHETCTLAAYAGWNTAGNTLGCALAQAVVRTVALRRGATLEEERAQAAFLFLRLLDDLAYQARVRSRCMFEDLPDLGVAPTFGRLTAAVAGQVLPRLEDRLRSEVQELSKLFVEAGVVRSVLISAVSLPWQRLFELACVVSVELPDEPLRKGVATMGT